MPTMGDLIRFKATGLLPGQSAEPKKPRWCGPIPKDCQMCGGTLGKVFYDAASKGGPWGIMCHSCFTVHGRGLGVGRGQKYDRKTGEKVAG